MRPTLPAGHRLIRGILAPGSAAIDQRTSDKGRADAK